MEDLKIIEALYYGTHLNEEELNEAESLLKQLELNLSLRVV